MNPVHSKSWLKHLETLSMKFRALQSPAWTQLPNPISEDSVLPGGLRLWTTTAFPLASYLHAFVYLGSLPHLFISLGGSSSASPAFRVLVECDLLGRKHVLVSQAPPVPLGCSFTASCGVEPFVSITHSDELCKRERRRLFCQHGPNSQPRVWWRKYSGCTC